ncbi:MFS transporter [Streptomyces laurentii]|uniref:MFS transporter n=1 Tax=Streptomyces laurentii TaxID=39478 RepID=UPI0036914F27
MSTPPRTTGAEDGAPAVARISGDASAQATGHRPRAGDLSLYAAGSVGMGLWVTVPGLLLLYFLTQTLGVPPFLAGTTLLLPKIIDIVVHPLLGSLSDRQARRASHRRTLLAWGLLLPAAWIALFSVPAGLTGTTAAWWVGGCYVAGNLLFACFQVPYLTTPSDLRIGYHERTRVFVFRMAFLTLGLLAAGVSAPVLVASGDRSAYTRMALLLAGPLLLSGLLALTGVRRLTGHCGFRVPGRRAHSVRHDLKAAWRDRDYRALLLSYLFTGTTTHLFLAALPFYTQYELGDRKLTAVLMGAFLVPATLVGPVWMRLSRRIGKQRGLLLAQSVFLAGSLALLPGRVLGTAVITVVVVLMGAAFAGLQLFAFSMLPDVVAAAEERGVAHAGAYTGVWTATEATGTATGPYVYAALLAVAGFVSTTDGHTTSQPSAALSALLWGFTALPAVLMALAVFFQRRYALDEVAGVDREAGA